MANRVIVIFVFVILLFGCSSYNINIYEIDSNNIIMSNSDKNNTMNNFLKFKLLPTETDTIIVIEDHKDKLILECIYYSFYWNEKEKYYRMCGKKGGIVVDTMSSFFSYNEELLRNTRNGEFEKIVLQINSDRSKYKDDEYLNIYRIIRNSGDFIIDVIRVCDADYFKKRDE